MPRPVSRNVIALTAGWRDVVAGLTESRTRHLSTQRHLVLLGLALWHDDRETATRILHTHPPLNAPIIWGDAALTPGYATLQPESDDLARPLLQVMAWHGHVSAVRFLVEHGALPGLPDAAGRDAAWMAVQRGHTGLALWLLTQRAVNPNAILRDGSRHTRLMAAVQASNPKAVAAILEKRAKVNACDREGRTALHHNLAQDPYTEDDALIAALLLAQHAAPDWEDNAGITPSLLATRHPDAVQALTPAAARDAQARVQALPATPRPPRPTPAIEPPPPTPPTPGPRSPSPDPPRPSPRTPRPGS